MLTFIHVNGNKVIVARWLFDIGPWRIVKDGWKIGLLRQSKWTMKF